MRTGGSSADGVLSSQSAVLFDFDGTLVPNLDLADLRRGVTAMAIAEGVPRVHIPPIHRARRSKNFRQETNGFLDVDTVIPI